MYQFAMQPQKLQKELSELWYCIACVHMDIFYINCFWLTPWGNTFILEQEWVKPIFQTLQEWNALDEK